MANIDEELRLASEAKTVIEKKPRKMLEILRKAALVARTQQRTMMFSSEARRQCRTACPSRHERQYSQTFLG
jgi:hypothetical protein